MGTRGAPEGRLWLFAEWEMVGKDGVGEPAVCGSHASLVHKCVLANIVDSPGQLGLTGAPIARDPLDSPSPAQVDQIVPTTSSQDDPNFLFSGHGSDLGNVSARRSI